MGINISDIIPRKEIEFHELKGKTIAIDAFNTLYQFLTTIRQPDGTPLMDSKGRVTSHLSGLFYRNISLLQEGIKPIYVFDGKIPDLKLKEIERRREAKKRAQDKFETAKEKEDVDEMRKYSAQFAKVTTEIIEESKNLLTYMGIPVIQAPGEGEAEASTLARKGLVWAAASQDYDSILYAAPRLIRNLTLARRRKTSSGLYVDVKIEMVEFEDVVNKLGLDRDGLICLAILVGTDYNPGGVRGLGQKRALEIVQKYKYPVEIFKHIELSGKYEINFNWQEVFRAFHEYETDAEEGIKSPKMDEKKIKEFLLEYDFSDNRIDSGIEKLKSLEANKKQKGLSEFF